MTLSQSSRAFDVRVAMPTQVFLSRMIEDQINFSSTASVVCEVDATQIDEMRRTQGEERISYTAFVIKALAHCLIKFPNANQRIVPGLIPFVLPRRIQKFKTADISVAAERTVSDSTSMAFTDVLRNAETLSLNEIDAWLKKLSSATEANNENWKTFRKFMRIWPSWIPQLIGMTAIYFPYRWWKWRGGAALVSSPCKYGGDFIITAWTSPLGISFGYVKKRPIVREDKIAIAPTFNLILNFDRRIIDGATAAKFMTAMKDFLENPN